MYLLHRLNEPGFRGNGYLTLVSAAMGIVQHSRIHASSVDDLPRVVARDALVLLGGRVVGIVQGMAERGDALPPILVERTNRIQDSLDLTERNVGLKDPTRSAWRQVAARGAKEGYRGHLHPQQAISMQEGVLSAHRTIVDIVAGLEGSLRRAEVEPALAARMAKIGLTLLAYGEYAPDIANFPVYRTPGHPSASNDMVGALTFAAGANEHPVREQLKVFMDNASKRFRAATLKAMAAPINTQAHAGIRPAAELDKSTNNY